MCGDRWKVGPSAAPDPDSVNKTKSKTLLCVIETRERQRLAVASSHDTSSPHKPTL